MKALLKTISRLECCWTLD